MKILQSVVLAIFVGVTACEPPLGHIPPFGAQDFAYSSYQSNSLPLMDQVIYHNGPIRFTDTPARTPSPVYRPPQHRPTTPRPPAYYLPSSTALPPAANYGLPSQPVPSRPVETYGPPHKVPQQPAKSTIVFTLPQPDVKYGLPQNPSLRPNSIHGPSPQAYRPQPPVTPSTIYGPPDREADVIQPEAPASLYGPPPTTTTTTEKSGYGYTTPAPDVPRVTYGQPPQTPSDTYGPPLPSVPSNTYGPPIAQAPTNFYGPPAEIMQQKASILFNTNDHK